MIVWCVGFFLLYSRLSSCGFCSFFFCIVCWDFFLSSFSFFVLSCIFFLWSFVTFVFEYFLSFLTLSVFLWIPFLSKFTSLSVSFLFYFSFVFFVWIVLCSRCGLGSLVVVCVWIYFVLFNFLLCWTLYFLLYLYYLFCSSFSDLFLVLFWNLVFMWLSELWFVFLVCTFWFFYPVFI